jgi:hypothetical protein
MSRARLLAALVGGLVLAALPFWRYAHGDRHALPHVDHAPRHGGRLVMVGDHHLELVRRSGRVEVFVSDARRRPLRPAEGWLFLGAGDRVPLHWEDHRLTAAADPDARGAQAVVVLMDGTRLEARLPDAGFLHETDFEKP